MALEAEGSNPSTHPNPLSGAGRGFFDILGCRQAVRPSTLTAVSRQFESDQPSFFNVFFDKFYFCRLVAEMVLPQS